MKPEIKQYQPPTHERHLEPEGRMPRCIESSALWQFLAMASIAIDSIPAQATLEGDKDRDVSLKHLAFSVLKMYNMPGPEEGGFEILFNYERVHRAKQEAMRCGLNWESRLDAWIASGGRAYDLLTREPEALNKSS